MKKKPHSDIFSEASKKPVKKKKKKTPSSSLSSQPDVKTEAESKSSKPVSIATKELEEILEKIHKMDDDLEGKMSRVCELSGMTRQEVHRFIENPDNFSQEQWKNAQKNKDILEEKIYSVVGVKAKKLKAKKKKKKLAKKRRGKTLGGRKGWLPM